MPGRSTTTIRAAGSDAVHGTMKNSLPSAASRQASSVALIRAASDGPMPGHRGDLLDRRVADALDRPEHLHQLALALRADAGQVVERGPDAPLGAQVAVIGDREAMRLVAQALDEVERR